METNSFSSKKLEEAVLQFSKLPGIGRKTALRLVLHLLKQEKEKVKQLVQAVEDLRENVVYCSVCNNLADHNVCDICANPHRRDSMICVVENVRDVISIESTGQFQGKYHVLGGLIAPLEGVGPDQLSIDMLKKRCEQADVQELIMALSPTIEGDTTVYYIAKLLKDAGDIRITGIARGVAFGGELEYTDELTLGKALNKRLPVENYISSL